ncbi:uroporphyrinogen-III C-methyltransferase [Neiella marina]|uniref:Uroporphyrinogen-III C-methyltransferase n=1 Tax=Neiella holothuriorum TaxID=2870530 RepID=A0ABS7EC92_9GAMM|nr:uroporphyrinogen-III C-methyltransferase [Neiella holothuriorum]MBW8189949.1 uroporphyrinogen-III C-methyltransferase [Neiella holothuriorum]
MTDRQQHTSPTTDSDNKPDDEHFVATAPTEDSPHVDTEPAEAIPESQPKHTATDKPRSNGVAVTALVLSFLSVIVIVLGLFAITMVWPKWQQKQQQFDEFVQEFSHRQKASLTVYEQLTTTNQNQQLSLEQLQGQLADSMLAQQRLQQRLQQLDGQKSNEWLLAEVDYLIRLATRKLWMERDVNGAIALLKSADLRVSELRDPQLLSLRRSLSDDMATLGALPKVDIDGIALVIDGLIGQLERLPLNALEIPESVGSSVEASVSTDPADWRANLMRSWQHFVDGFIAVNRRADGATPLLPPDQRWYLRANIRLSLQQAQLAALRNQPQLFINAINQSDDWLREYFDNSDSAVQYVRETLAELAISPVQVQLPSDLHSRKMIRDLLSTSNGTTTATTEDAPAPSAQQAQDSQPNTAPDAAEQPSAPAATEPADNVELESESITELDNAAPAEPVMEVEPEPTLPDEPVEEAL